MVDKSVENSKVSKKEFKELKGVEGFDHLNGILGQMLSVSKNKPSKFYNPVADMQRNDFDMFNEEDEDKPKTPKK